MSSGCTSTRSIINVIFEVLISCPDFDHAREPELQLRTGMGSNVNCQGLFRYILVDRLVVIRHGITKYVRETHKGHYRDQYEN
jgi:hypothetical protein